MSQLRAAPPSDLPDAALRHAAAEAVHARLALVTFLVWTLGVFCVYIAAPENSRDAWGMIAALALLPVAAAPWLLRSRLTEIDIARRSAARPDENP